LVTLVGRGGVGTIRLAIEEVRAQGQELAGGVVFVPLAIAHRVHLVLKGFPRDKWWGN
jgi:hypothetical protein